MVFQAEILDFDTILKVDFSWLEKLSTVLIVKKFSFNHFFLTFPRNYILVQRYSLPCQLRDTFPCFSGFHPTKFIRNVSEVVSPWPPRQNVFCSVGKINFHLTSIQRIPHGKTPQNVPTISWQDVSSVGRTIAYCYQAQPLLSRWEDSKHTWV